LIIVPGSGPRPCRVMAIGERPGEKEFEVGAPFVGPAGQEFDRYLFQYTGLQRPAVYATNLVKDYREGNPDPRPWEIKRDWAALEEELAAVRPEWIVTVGGFATRQFLGNIPMEVCHGMPYAWRDYKVMPAYHPAAGLHDAATQPRIAWDFQRLGQLLVGNIPSAPREDGFDGMEMYTELRRAPLGPSDPDRALQEYFIREALRGEFLAVDTEGSRVDAWGLSFSYGSGSAFVLHHERGRELLQLFAELSVASDTLFVFHNVIHDLEVLEAFNIYPRNYTCTMTMAHHLQVEPQGLKPLARRWLGMEMKSYPEIVAPAQERLAIPYLAEVMSRESWGEPLDVADYVEGELKIKKPWSLAKYAQRILKDNAAGKPIDFRKRWENIDYERRQFVERELGPLPEPTLDDIDHETAIWYAARDADVTGRLYPLLRERMAAA
jgi:uracil-DNA glycosylase family 4